MAATLAIAPLRQPMLQIGRQLHVVESEHGQRQQHEQAAERADHPGILKPGLHVLPQQRRQHARHGVGRRHRQYVDQRQPKRPPPGQKSALTGNQAGQDRDHRKYAGGERQQQAEAKECRNGQKALLVEQPRQPVRLGFGGFGRCARGSGRGGRRGQRQGR